MHAPGARCRAMGNSSIVTTAKTVVGYCEPFSVRPGETVSLMVSSLEAGEGQVDVTRLRCGDPYAGLDELLVDLDVTPPRFAARPQPLRPGSYAVVDAAPRSTASRSSGSGCGSGPRSPETGGPRSSSVTATTRPRSAGRCSSTATACPGCGSAPTRWSGGRRSSATDGWRSKPASTPDRCGSGRCRCPPARRGRTSPARPPRSEPDGRPARPVSSRAPVAAC